MPTPSLPTRGAVLTVSSSPRSVRMGRLARQSLPAMTPAERRRVAAMYGVIAGLHVLGFVILFAFVVPSHYKGLGIGVAVLAYTLGLRHAFDADHISAIDNTTRKVLGERHGTSQPRPFGFGFFFSLGHSTVVVAMGVAIVVALGLAEPAAVVGDDPVAGLQQHPDLLVPGPAAERVLVDQHDGLADAVVLVVDLDVCVVLLADSDLGHEASFL